MSKILVVTKDNALMQLLVMMLEATSWEVLSGDPDDAPELLMANEDIAAILVDVVIPYEWVFLFAELWTIQPRNAEIVVLTALEEPGLISQLRAYGITKVVSKPAKFAELIENIGRKTDGS